MQVSYNKFKQLVDSSNEKLFDKIAEAIATSDNAALVAMFDDKLILLDEKKNDLYLADYVFENAVLTMHNFQPIELSENDGTYLDEAVGRYFDLDDETPISVNDLMTGFRLKYKNESSSIVTEACDRKAKKIQKSPKIRAIKKARKCRDTFCEDIKSLMEEPFMKHLTLKVASDQDSIPTALNTVAWNNTYPISVNTDIGSPSPELITLKDNTNVMDAMKGVALKISDKWKNDAFRAKFWDMISKIVQTESLELAKTSVYNFLDENKELFLLKDDRFNELITKTTLMLGEGNTEPILNIFKTIMESKKGRMMKNDYFQKYNITEEALDKINAEPAEGEDADQNIPVDSGSKATSSDLDDESVDKVISVFKKIQSAIKEKGEDTPESDYVAGIIDSLKSFKESGVDSDSTMKDVVEFLNNAGSTKEDDTDSSSAPSSKEPTDDASGATGDSTATAEGNF